MFVTLLPYCPSVYLNYKWLMTYGPHVESVSTLTFLAMTLSSLSFCALLVLKDGFHPSTLRVLCVVKLNRVFIPQRWYVELL